MTATSTPTFTDLCTLDPRLSALLAEARRDDTGTTACYCAMYRWPAFKRRMCALVGFFAQVGQPAELLTRDSYDVVYRTLFKALPPCHGCCHVPHDAATGSTAILLRCNRRC
jgi:hypothetical protein